MSLSQYALITNPQDVFDYLVMDDEQTTKYATHVERWINACSRQLERLCNRNLKARDYDVTVDGNGKRALILEHYPINSITTVEISTWDLNQTYTIDPDTDLVYDSDTGIVTLLSPANTSVWLPGRENIHLEYNAGYASSDDLELFKDAVLELILIRWREMGGNPLEFQRADKIGNSVSFTKFQPKNLPHIVEQVVREYRRAEV